MDQDEAAEIVEAQLPELGPERLYDEVMLPALTYARRDRARGRLTDAELLFVARASREILEGTLASEPPVTPSRGRVLGVAARDEADEVALRMLGELLAPWGVTVELLSASMLAAEVISLVEEARPACICVAALRPGGLAHTRYLLKRLRVKFPDVRIVVGRWGSADLEEDAASLVAAGATRVGMVLTVTRDHVLELLPSAPQGASLARSA